MDSEKINGPVDTDDIAVVQISNKNQWRHHKKVLT